MNDKQIVEYCKNIVLNNLAAYDMNPTTIAEILTLKDKTDKKKSNKRYLEHFKALKDMLEKAIKTMEENE